MRSGSLAPIACLNATATASLETGPGQVFSVVGALEPPTGANAPRAVAQPLGGAAPRPVRSAHGVVVDSVNVSVFE